MNRSLLSHFFQPARQDAVLGQPSRILLYCSHPPSPEKTCYSVERRERVIWNSTANYSTYSTFYGVKRRRYLRPPMSDRAPDGVIGISMQRRVYRHLKHPDQRPLRPLRPLKLFQTKIAISPAADVGHGRRWCHWNQHEKTRLLTPHTSWSEASEAADIQLTPIWTIS